MNQIITPRHEILVLELHGRMDSHTAGQTYDTLVALARSGHPALVVDLSGVDYVTRAGVRGLVVAARMLIVEGGEMRICRAGPRATELLLGIGYRHLLKLDDTRAQSLAILEPWGGMATSIAEFLTAPARPATIVDGRSISQQQAVRGPQGHVPSRQRVLS